MTEILVRDSYGVRYGVHGWEAYVTVRGTMTEAEAVKKADKARSLRFSKRKS